jgi:predicted O-methyltransferase YrrM
MKNDLHYEKHCLLLRETSADAAAYFQVNDIFFDMVHVDANHDTEKVVADISLYLPRLRDGGFLILDDVSFKSVRPAYDKLSAKTTLVFERIDHDRANDYAIFRKNTPSPDARYDRRVWIRNFW